MNTKKCKDCGSTNLLITTDTNGKVFAITCIDCGWEYESKEFKSLAAQMDDIINNFDRKDILNTKEKLI
jgi:transcription elongation factor Elf1